MPAATECPRSKFHASSATEIKSADNLKDEENCSRGDYDVDRPSSKRGVAICQQDIFRWYENHNDDGADNIFSKEVGMQIDVWLTELTAKGVNEQNRAKVVAEYESEPRNLDFSTFFAYPVPAFALWRLLDACYELDEKVFAYSDEKLPMIVSWRNLRPLEYLLSEGTKEEWEMEIRNASGKPTKISIEEQLYGIGLCFQTIEKRLVSLKETFSSSNEQGDNANWILNTAKEALREKWILVESLYWALLQSLTQNMETSRQDPASQNGSDNADMCLPVSESFSSPQSHSLSAEPSHPGGSKKRKYHSFSQAGSPNRGSRKNSPLPATPTKHLRSGHKW